MTLLINVIIFVAIFGYAAYTLYKFFNRSTQGKCGSCDTDCNCCLLYTSDAADE